MPDAQPNAYLKTKVMTAGPAELRLLLLDGALKFARRAKEGLEAKDHDRVYDGITRCQNILMELINSLRPDRDPDLCGRLSGLYTYLYSRLMHAIRAKDTALVDEVIGLLEYERETWALLMERLKAENTAASTVTDLPPGSTPSTRTDHRGAKSAHRELVGGRLSVQG